MDIHANTISKVDTHTKILMIRPVEPFLKPVFDPNEALAIANTIRQLELKFPSYISVLGETVINRSTFISHLNVLSEPLEINIIDTESLPESYKIVMGFIKLLISSSENKLGLNIELTAKEINDRVEHILRMLRQEFFDKKINEKQLKQFYALTILSGRVFNYTAKVLV